MTFRRVGALGGRRYSWVELSPPTDQFGQACSFSDCICTGIIIQGSQLAGSLRFLPSNDHAIEVNTILGLESKYA